MFEEIRELVHKIFQILIATEDAKQILMSHAKGVFVVFVKISPPAKGERLLLVSENVLPDTWILCLSILLSDKLSGITEEIDTKISELQKKRKDDCKVMEIKAKELWNNSV